MPTASEVHAQLTTWIAATDTSAADYAQPDATTGTRSAWHCSTVPLVPEYEPNPRAHLAFFVDDRDESNQSDADATSIVITSTLTVWFLFRLRPRTLTADWRLAADSLRALRLRLMDHAAVGSLDLSIALPSGPFASRRPVGLQEQAGAGWLACSLRILAIYTDTPI